MTSRFSTLNTFPTATAKGDSRVGDDKIVAVGVEGDCFVLLGAVDCFGVLLEKSVLNKFMAFVRSRVMLLQPKFPPTCIHATSDGCNRFA